MGFNEQVWNVGLYLRSNPWIPFINARNQVINELQFHSPGFQIPIISVFEFSNPVSRALSNEMIGRSIPEFLLTFYYVA